MRALLPLLLLAACKGGGGDDPPDEIEPEFLGDYVVTSFEEGFGCTPDSAGDFGGTHAQIAVGSFFGLKTVEVYVCSAPGVCDTEFSEYFLQLDDARSASGEVTAWSQSGDTCSLTWATTSLTMDGTTVVIESRSENNADIVNGADLDECEVALDTYTGAVDCSFSDRLVLTPI
ncbi:MAG: hypothetical protein H6737_06565 [Alphaproteobacteria bacterium]|nr:hypothetical protein [Alphaproteobacteria bacterium]